MMRSLRGQSKTAVMAATAVLGEGPLFLFDYLLRLLRVLLLVALWRSVMAGRGETDGFTLGTVLTYTLVAELFAEQLSVRTQLTQTFWEGTVVNRFLQPIGLVPLYASEMVGRWLFNLAFFSLPLLLLAPLLGVDPRPVSAAAGWLFLLSLGLGISVGLAIDFLFGAITIALEQPVWLVDYIRSAVATVLSGALLPLALLPWEIGAAVAWLPFASTAWAPLAIYTGTDEPLGLLLRQIGWSLVLWPATLWLWRANREKMVGYGG